jgi:hypothetical protein
MKSKPRYPIFIASKGRWDQRHTMKALDTMGQHYRVIVEEHEYRKYLPFISKTQLLVLPQKYLDEYDTFDALEDSKSKGAGAARNFAWDTAVAEGWGRHWILDDNIYYFVRATYNLNAVSYSSAIFAAAEDFVDRYENIAIAGFNYVKFCQAKTVFPPYILNTRIYSCLLIRNDLPYRWRGRYNEDTDLSLRALKDGWCTLEFQAFLADKATTRKVGGGNTKEFYDKEGTWAKSEMLARMHPDVAKVVWRFNRWHHHVDYSGFKRNNQLRLRPDVMVPRGINNYGMKLIYPEELGKGA